MKSVDTGQYGNAEFVKDSLTDTKSFLVYRAFADNTGAAFTNKHVQVGYEVIVYRKIVNYKSNTRNRTGTKMFLIQLTFQVLIKLSYLRRHIR